MPHGPGAPCGEARGLAWELRSPAPQRGPVDLSSSFRLIMVKAQLGLIQESVVHRRLFGHLQDSVLPGQSGYVRDVGDAHLALHELAAAAAAQGRPLWVIFSDLQKAFPRTWREGLLHRLREQAGVSDGMLALLGSMFEKDIIHVNFNGVETVPVTQGIAEGGTVGPLTFPSYMDTLAQDLLVAGCGAGVGIRMPPAWSGHRWAGTGEPSQGQTMHLLHALATRAPLPPPKALLQDPTLEASALAALDAAAPRRIGALLHADDPALLASSWGGARRSLQVLADWAYRWKASPHTKASKHAVVVHGSQTARAAAASAPPLLLPLRGLPPVQVDLAPKHKWLGLQWPGDLSLLGALEARLAVASAQCASLAGHVAAGALPLAAAAHIFDMEIDASLRFGRWLLATAEGALARLDSAYEGWARALLGSHPWRDGAVAVSELGWSLSGGARAILDIASRRAGLWLLPDGDLYKGIFVLGHISTGRTWASVSLALLDEWDLQDWPAWVGAARGESALPAYKAYIRDTLKARCNAALRLRLHARVRVPAPLSLGPVPRDDLSTALSLRLPSPALFGQRSLSRLRCQLLVLSHSAGVRSRARRQICVCCQGQILSPTLHILGSCGSTGVARAAFWAARGSRPPPSREGAVREILSVRPGEAGFEEAAALARDIDLAVSKFWGPAAD